MPIFDYNARDKTGGLLTGQRMAQTADMLSGALIKEGLIPIEIISNDEKRGLWQKLVDSFEPPVTRDELGVFARQMYSLCKTGVPLALALRNMATSTSNRKLRLGLLDLVESLESGQDMASAMQNHPQIFTPIMISIVRVGQSSGHLAESFLRINQFLELEGGAIKNVKAAMRYPMFVFIAMVAAMAMINLFVIPSFARVFAQAHVELPVLTRFLMAFSTGFSQHWLLLLLTILATVSGFHYYINTPQGRYRWDALLLKIPFVGIMLKRIILLRFAQSFAITINAGIPLIEGMDLIAQSVNNAYAAKRITLMREAIERGNNLAQAAAVTNLFTPMELQIMSISEATGELGPMLEQIAAFYRREVDYDLKRLSDVVEPILIVILSGMILVLAFAVYLPIWNMAKLAKIG